MLMVFQMVGLFVLSLLISFTLFLIIPLFVLIKIRQRRNEP